MNQCLRKKHLLKAKKIQVHGVILPWKGNVNGPLLQQTIIEVFYNEFNIILNRYHLNLLQFSEGNYTHPKLGKIKNFPSLQMEVEGTPEIH